MSRHGVLSAGKMSRHIDPVSRQGGMWGATSQAMRFIAGFAEPSVVSALGKARASISMRRLPQRGSHSRKAISSANAPSTAQGVLILLMGLAVEVGGHPPFDLEHCADASRRCIRHDACADVGGTAELARADLPPPACACV